METNKLTAAKNLEEWQKAFLQKIADDDARQDLFDILYLLWDMRDSGSCLPFVASLLSHFILKGGDLNEQRYNIRDIVSLFGQLDKLMVDFNTFDNNSNYTRGYHRQEVKRG